MKTVRLSPFVVLASLALAGCGASAPVRYHALGTGADQPGPSGGAAVLVELLPVAVPERLNRDEVVLSGGTGALTVLDGDRWAAPLADEIRQSVDDALWRRLRAADVYAAPVQASQGNLPQYRIALRIERMEAQPAVGALVEASWTLRRLPQGAASVCRASFTSPLSGGNPADAAVAAWTEASGRMARAVAASLDHLNRGSADPCGAEGHS